MLFKKKKKSDDIFVPWLEDAISHHLASVYKIDKQCPLTPGAGWIQKSYISK